MGDWTDQEQPRTPPPGDTAERVDRLMRARSRGLTVVTPPAPPPPPDPPAPRFVAPARRPRTVDPGGIAAARQRARAQEAREWLALGVILGFALCALLCAVMALGILSAGR